MLLTLNNFKSWDSHTFEFKPGFTIVTGKSGNGKTSLFKAIVFAIQNVGNRSQTFGKKGCNVKLQLEDLTFTRFKGPHKLISSEEESESHIQLQIDSKFGKFFDICNYIPQKGHKSFMYLPAADKLRFLESFILDDIEDKKDGVKGRIKSLHTKLIQIQTQIRVNERICTPTEVVCEFNPSTFFDEFKEVEKEYLRLKSVYENNERVQNRRRELEGKDTTPLMFDIKLFDELNENLPLLIKRENLLNTKFPKLTLPIIDTTDYTRDISEQKEYTKILKEFNSLPKVTSQELVKKFYKCINCKEMLWFDNEELVKADVSDEMQNLKIKTDISVQELDKKRKIYERRKVLKAKLKTFSFDMNCTQKAEKQKNATFEYMRIQIQIETIARDKARIQKELEAPNFRLTRQETLNEIQRLKDIDTENQRRKMQRKLIDDELKVLKVIEIQNYSDVQKEYVRYKQAQPLVYEFIEYQKEMVRFQLITEELTTLQQQETQILEKTEALSHILTTIQRAENLAIQECVSQLNTSAKLYLSVFFSDPIGVELKTFKETKKGSKPQIDTTIFLNGTSDYDFSDLSGGEKDRVALAFTLALTEMSPINWILLDEAISSLDEDTFHTVIQGMRMYFKGNVIMTGQQVSTGLFDHWIKV